MFAGWFAANLRSLRIFGFLFIRGQKVMAGGAVLRWFSGTRVLFVVAAEASVKIHMPDIVGVSRLSSSYLGLRFEVNQS